MNTLHSHFYEKYVDSIKNSLLKTEITDLAGDLISHDDGFKKLCEYSGHTAGDRKKQIICGNGASAAFANHMALDWSKNGGVRTISFSSPAILTAVGNDMGYDQSFAAPLDWYAESGDLLVTISSSGNSRNIVNTIAKAREKGLKVVTLSGLKPDNASRASGDVNLYVPAKTYGVVECVHQVILHVWLDLYMGVTEWDRESFQNMNISDFQL